MDLKSIIIDEEQKAQDEILKALLSDKLFNEFDPALWASASGHIFAEKAFPILAKYHLGKVLDELIKGHEWLTNLAVPSKRHESAHVLQMNPARNLAILDLVTKLQFLKIWDRPCCKNIQLAVYITKWLESSQRDGLLLPRTNSRVSHYLGPFQTQNKRRKGVLKSMIWTWS